MTSAAKIAAALKKLGDAHYQAADEILSAAGDLVAGASTPPDAPVPRPVAAALPAAAPVESDFAEGSEAMCPIHKRAMKPKPFDASVLGCTAQGTDPAWTNPKGYCTITSKNVATYLRMKAAAA